MDKELALSGNLETGADLLVGDAGLLLLKAQKEAELARMVARQAISRAFKKSGDEVKQAEDLTADFDDAAGVKTRKSPGSERDALKAVSGAAKRFFARKDDNAKTRREFYDLVLRQSKELKELVDDMVWEQAQEIIDKAVEEAKSDRIASKVAVRQAQEEAEASKKDTAEAIAIAQELVAQAQAEAAAAKKSAGLALSRARGEAVSRAEAEVKKARDEALAAKEAAGVAIKRVEDEVQRIKEEAEIAGRKFREAMVQARAQSYQDVCGELNIIKEEAEATRQAARDAIARVQEDSRKAKEEADAIKKSAEETLARAREESRKGQEEADKARRTVLEMRSEIARVKSEAEASILMANEAMKRARQDIIGVTIGEITRTRRELEAAGRDPRMLFNGSPCGLLERIYEKPCFVKSPVSPQALINAAVQGAQKEAARNKNIIILSLPNSLPPVEADGRRIGEVLHRLIDRAVRSSAEGNAITVRAESCDAGLLVQVKDHGAGIPAEELALIFANDGRADGAGLCDCREIIEEHGGRIWAESLEGQGSTFSFTLPLSSSLS